MTNTVEGKDSIAAMTAAIATGDERAFDRFYAAWFDRVHRYLLVIAAGWTEGARDALQETMLRAARSMKPFPTSGDLWNWLRRVAKNSFYDQLRREKRREAGLVRLSAFRSEPEDLSGDKDASAAELKEHLAACLATLPKEERDLVAGKYFEAKSGETLARDLDLTTKAVESRLARIRKKLKAKIMKRLER